MKINLDRLCKLAGVETSQEGTLNEASNRSLHDDPAVSDEADYRFGQNQLAEVDHSDDKDEGMGRVMYEDEPPEGAADEIAALEEVEDDKNELYAEEDIGSDANEMAYEEGEVQEENLDEMIEVDEAMLVQELRRARAMLQESREAGSQEELTEAQLRSIVAEEVSNIMKDFNLTAGWIYGEDKPTNSKPGQVITSMPGLGFKSFDK